MSLKKFFKAVRKSLGKYEKLYPTGMPIFAHKDLKSGDKYIMIFGYGHVDVFKEKLKVIVESWKL